MEKNITKETIRLLNVNVYCEHVLQDKPAILLIHGFVSSTYTFHRLVPLLQDHFSIIAFDLPGFGRSEKSTTFVYSYQQYAALIKKLIHYFNLDHVIIAGHSLGGQIALQTAKYFPNNIDTLILFSSSGYLQRANKWIILCSHLPFFNVVAKNKIKDQSVLQNLQQVLYDHSLINDQLIKEYERPLKDKNFYKSLIRLLRHREDDLTSDELKNIKIPTLLIWGKEDRVVPVRVGKKLAQDLPDAKLIVYEKTGHLITEEKPEEIYHDMHHYLTNSKTC